MLQGVQQNRIDITSYARPQADTEVSKQRDAIGQASGIKLISSGAQEAKIPDIGPAYTLEISEEGIKAQQADLNGATRKELDAGQPLTNAASAAPSLAGAAKGAAEAMEKIME